MSQLTRKQLLAAEIHGYSYDNYADHLGIGNIRFEKLMPQDVDVLERAERENWEATRIAQALDIPVKEVATWQRSYQQAKAIVDAATLVEAFRSGIRISIQTAIEQGLSDKASVERLVTQICYRTADLSFRLEMAKKKLSDYSEELRKETEADLEALNKAIDQDLNKSKAA
jgi:hypothetical protein